MLRHLVSRLFLVAAAILALVPALRAADQAADEWHWISLGPDRPVLIRMHVRFAGQPYAQAFAQAQREYVEHLFRFLDRDGDGGLTQVEARHMPPPQLQLAATGLDVDPSEVHFAFNFQALDQTRDGRLSPGELTDYMMAFSDGAVRLAVPTRAAAASPDEALYVRLDSDASGGLSSDELTAADRLLALLDADDDETLDPREISPVASEVFVGTATSPPPAALGLGPGGSTLFAATSPQQAAARLWSAYRPPGDAPPAGLSPADLGIGITSFNRLDRNGDGLLDQADLAGFLRGPSDVELTIDLDPAQGESPLTIVHPAPGVEGGPAALDVTPRECLLSLGGPRQLRITVAGAGAGPGALRAAVAEDFQASDTDGDGVVKADEARGSLFRNTLSLMDADGDGRLEPAEQDAFATLFLDRYVRVTVHRVAFWISPPGRGLFDMIDWDRDGRLGRRELGSARRLGAIWDGNRNGDLERAEVPESYVLSAGPMHAGPGRQAIDCVLPGEAVGLLLADMPRWYRLMDTNNDGDVSQREFLGAAEHFDRFDANRDLLLTRDEAQSIR